MLLSRTITAPTCLRSQVERDATSLAMRMKYSSHDARCRMPSSPRAPTGPRGAAHTTTRAPPVGQAPRRFLVALARRERADLVVVGPEAPLVAGVVDALEEAGIAAFGPRREAAMLEGSKAFLKRFATRHGIPTAPYAIATTFAEAEAAIRRR